MQRDNYLATLEFILLNVALGEKIKQIGFLVTILLLTLSSGIGHFCRPLHVAMQTRLYLHPFGARRVVVTGSLAGLPSVLSQREFHRYSHVLSRSVSASRRLAFNLFANWPLIRVFAFCYLCPSLAPPNGAVISAALSVSLRSSDRLINRFRGARRSVSRQLSLRLNVVSFYRGVHSFGAFIIAAVTRRRPHLVKDCIKRT